MGGPPSQGSSRCSGGGWWGDGELGGVTSDGQGCHRRSPVLVERRQRLRIRPSMRSCLPANQARGLEHADGAPLQKSSNGRGVTTEHSSVIFLFPAATRALARGVAGRRRKGDGCEEERGAHGTQHRLDGGGQLLHLVRARARVS